MAILEKAGLRASVGSGADLEIKTCRYARGIQYLGGPGPTIDDVSKIILS
jgi:hypothetical protein